MDRSLKQICLISITIFLQFQIGICQQKVMFDIKTKQFEKFDFIPIKIATTIILLNSDWAGVIEVGEDYSLWLKNYQRKQVDEEIIISFDVEIRTPAMLRSGSLLTTGKVDYSFNAAEEWEGVKSTREAIERELKDYSEEINTEAKMGGEEVEKCAKMLMQQL